METMCNQYYAGRATLTTPTLNISRIDQAREMQKKVVKLYIKMRGLIDTIY